MTVYLSSKKEGGFHFNNCAWSKILNLAEQYGWEPAGTIDPYWADEPDTHEWNGNYTSHDGQAVKSEDAENMADALEKSLKDIRAVDRDTVVERIIRENPEHSWGPSWYMTPHEFWGTGSKGKQIIKDLIKFCKQGGFRIF
jgi:hypothetical protein